MAKKTTLTKVQKIALKYAELLKTNMKVKKVYLFGSYAKGTQHLDSDIDIAVVSDDFKGHPVDDVVLLMRYSRNIDTSIEPHPFFPDKFNKSYPFAKEIIETGIRLV